MTWIRGLKEEDKKLIGMEQDEFDKFMCEKFSGIFRDRNEPMTETRMCWGFSVGAGWRPWLLEACEKIDFLQDHSNFKFVADQVKEKFGGLRFYYHLEKIDGADPKDEYGDRIIKSLIQDAVSIAEDKCYHYCERCGEVGSQTVDVRWVKTLCNECARKDGRTTKSMEEEKEYEERQKARAKDDKDV